MDIIQFCLETLSSFACASSSSSSSSSSTDEINLDTLAPEQIFSTAKRVLEFQESMRNHGNNNRFEILEDLASIITSEDDDTFKTIQLVLIIETISMFGNKDETSSDDNARLEKTFSESLQEVFNEATNAISSSSSSSYYSRIAATCLARLVLLDRLDVTPFFLFLADEIDFDGNHNNSDHHNNNHHHESGNKYKLALEIVSQVSSSSEKTPSSRLAHEILTVVLNTITKAIQLDSERVKELSRRILHPILESNPELKKERREDLKNAVKSLATYPSRQSEAVMLIASLFEVLIDHNVGKATGDLRSEDFLWELILSCLKRVSSFNEDPSVKTNIHNQAIYLLKRIVSSTGGKDLNLQVVAADSTSSKKKNDKNKNKNNNNTRDEKQHSSSASSCSYIPPTQSREVFDPQGIFFWGNQPQTADSYFSHWSQFFVIFETLNEYSSHLCEPATKSLKLLWDGEFIHPRFIEAALFKAMIHANVSVRRAALSLIWSFDPKKVVRDLSVEFLGKTLLLGAGDPRLCQEVDRSVVFSSLLNGMEAKESAGTNPPVLATVVRLSQFYCTLIDACVEVFYERKNSSSCCSFVSTVQSLLQQLISAVSTNPDSILHFHLAVFCRVFRDFAHHIRSNLIMKFPQLHFEISSIFSPSICEDLGKLLVNSIHSRRPAWIESRFVALIVDAALTFPRSQVVVIGDNKRSSCKDDDEDETVKMTTTATKKEIDTALMRLLCVAGPLAEAGGKSQSPVDAVGVVLPVGSSLPLPLLRQMMNDHSVFDAETNVTSVTDISNFIFQSQHQQQYHSTTSTSAVLDISQMKSLCFQCYDVAPAVSKACEILSSLDHRTALSPQVVVRAAAVFAEFATYDGPEVTSLFLDSERSSSLHQSSHQFCCCATLVRNIVSFSNRFLVDTMMMLSNKNSSSSCSSSSSSLLTIMEIDSWDAICAALFWSVKFGVSTKQSSRVPFDLLWSTCESLLSKLIEQQQHQHQTPSSSSSSQAQLQLQMILERNLIRFVQAAAGAVAAASTSSKNSNDNIQPDIALRLSRFCCQLKPLRTSVDAISELSSGLTWSLVCAQHYRATWSSCLVFLTHTHHSQNNNINATEFAERCLDELDCCAPNNLSCIFDVLCFVMTHHLKKTPGDDHHDLALRIAKSMRARIVDGYRKERLRCAPSYCFAVCRCEALFGNDDSDSSFELMMNDLLLPLLREEEEASQRIPYVVAQAVSERALSDDKIKLSSRWLGTRNLLLHISIFVNTFIDDLDETEACYACMEPALHLSSSPSSSSLSMLSSIYPPTTRMVALARASALRALHHHVATDETKLMWTIETLLDWSEHKKEVCGKDINATCMVNSNVFRNRYRLWQTLTSLAVFVPENRWSSLMEKLLNKSLAVVNPSSIRRLIEGFCFAGFSVSPQTTIPHLLQVAKNFDARPFMVSSYLQLAAMILINNNLDDQTTTTTTTNVFSNQLLEFLVQYCSSHQHLLRVISGLALVDLVNGHSTSDIISSTNSPFHPDNNATVKFVTTHPECLKFYEKYSAVTGFKTILWRNPTLLFCVQRQDGVQWLHDTMPAVFFERVARCEDELRSFFSSLCVFDFYRGAVLGGPVDEMWMEVKKSSSSSASLPSVDLTSSSSSSIRESDLYLDYEEVIASMKNVVSTSGDDENAASSTSNEGEQQQPQTTNQTKNILSNLQRKTVPWWQSSIHTSNELVSSCRQTNNTNRQQLIIVASLLDNPVNIAGLFRSAEIFAAEKSSSQTSKSSPILTSLLPLALPNLGSPTSKFLSRTSPSSSDLKKKEDTQFAQLNKLQIAFLFRIILSRRRRFWF